jgi:hypothetical protein
MMKTAQQEVAAHHINSSACHWLNNQSRAHNQNIVLPTNAVSISQPAGQIHAFIQSADSVLRDWEVACMYARCMVTNMQADHDDKVSRNSTKTQVHDTDHNEGSIQLGTVQAAVAAKLLPLTNRDVKKRNAAWGYKVSSLLLINHLASVPASHPLRAWNAHGYATHRQCCVSISSLGRFVCEDGSRIVGRLCVVVRS